MTNIRYEHTDSVHSIEIKGHSGYAHSGADIICSAISVLTYSFSVMLEEYADQKRISIITEDVEDGYTRLEYLDVMNETKELLMMLYIGFYALSEQYSEYVSLEWGEKDI